jgi:hypothetical protein
MPGPGTGIVTVKGTVDIGAMPDVKAVQAGDWSVSLANTANVRVAATAPLPFVQLGRRYRITWSAGESEDVAVRGVATGGWVNAEGPGGRRRWINLDQARAVEEL